MKRQLFEKQAYEASKLESQLRTQEIADINNVLDKTANRKTDVINEAKQVVVSSFYNLCKQVIVSSFCNISKQLVVSSVCNVSQLAVVFSFYNISKQVVVSSFCL